MKFGQVIIDDPGLILRIRNAKGYITVGHVTPSLLKHTRKFDHVIIQCSRMAYNF